MKHPKMLEQTVLGFLCLTLVSLVTLSSAVCPLGCACLWKAGKRTVECIDRNFYAIPEGIDLDTQVLDLSSNNLSPLQKDIFINLGITNIQKLYLRKCRIELIHDRAFRGVTNMDELDLSDNQLSTIPSLIYIPYLKSINLAHNPIHQITSYSFQSTPGIRYIDLSNCQIHTIYSEAFYGIDKIDTLKLNGNKLASLKPRTIDKLPYIRNLDINDNPWQCDCKLRSVKMFIDKYKIQFSFEPICISGPKRNIGQTFTELSVNDFACVPDIDITHNSEVVREKVELQRGNNLTLECRIQSLTPCRVMWSVNQKIFDSANWHNHKINVKEETLGPNENPFPNVLLPGNIEPLNGGNSDEEVIYDQKSVLTVINPQIAVDEGNYICIVENHAGRSEKLISVKINEPEVAAGSIQLRSLLVALFVVLLLIAFGILLIKMVNRNINNAIVKSSNSSVGSVTKNTSIEETNNFENSTELPARPPLPKDIDLQNAEVQCSSDLDLVSSTRYNEWQYSTPEHFNRSKSSSGFYDINDSLPIINLSSQNSNSIQDFPPDFGLPVVNDYEKIPSAKTLRVWQRGVPVLPQYTSGKRSIISFRNNQATDV